MNDFDDPEGRTPSTPPAPDHNDGAAESSPPEDSGPRPRPRPPEAPATGPRPRPRPEGEDLERTVEAEPPRAAGLRESTAPAAPAGPTPRPASSGGEARPAEREAASWDEARRAADAVRRARPGIDDELRTLRTPAPTPRPDRLRQVMEEVERFSRDGYGLLGMIGYPNAGKTYALIALTHLLSNFDVDVRDTLRAELLPGHTAADVFMRPYHGDPDTGEDRTIFLDAGGELFSRLRNNEWDVLPESMALLHALSQAKGLLFTIALHHGHFQSAGMRPDATAEEVEAVRQAQDAQEEQGLVDLALLFLRAVRKEGGEVEPVVELCRKGKSVSEALQAYRVGPQKLDTPVAILFTKADQWVDKELDLGHGAFLRPYDRPIGVAPFVRDHLPFLYNAARSHCRRFHFDFAQAYFEDARRSPGTPDAGATGGREWKLDGRPWVNDGEPMSVGLLPAVEFLLRNKPRRDRLGRVLQRLEIGTGTAHRIHRRLHPRLWRGTGR